MKIVSPHYASTINQNEYVWLSYDNGNPDLKIAPAFTETYDIII